MAVVFQPLQQLTKNDLNIFIKDENGQLFDPEYIAYSLEDEDGHSLLTQQINTPSKESIGWYWVNISIPSDTPVGTYIVYWHVRDNANSMIQQVDQKFGVVRKQDSISYTPTIGGVVYYPGQSLTEKDLYIIIRNQIGNQADAYSIHYEIFQRVSGLEVLVSPQDLPPIRLGVGHYFANYLIPSDSIPGDYYIKWKFQETPTSEINYATQEFAVIDGTVRVTSPYTSTATNLIRKLRYILRDNNPDRNYHFMPPAQEEVVQGFTQKFGYVWEDDELYEYIDYAIQDLNNRPPRESWSIDDLTSRLNAVVLSLAAAVGLRALSVNWVHDEWQGDISGVGLNLEKSSKYMSLKENFEAAYDKQIEEHKTYGVRFIIGVRQARYSVGVTSALGPYSRMGVQSRRNYISGSNPQF